MNMSTISLVSLRHALLVTSASVATLGLAIHAGPSLAQTVATAASASIAAQDSTIRQFRIDIPEAALADLRRRIAATRWPDRETVSDQSQGVQLAKLQDLVCYWGTDYDWRKAEARLNALPQFITTIDGVDIQFTHVRSPHPSAMPLIMTHGWPGSALELLKVVGPLTDPTAHGGRAEDAFDLVLPTYPGYGFSGKPTEAWNPGPRRSGLGPPDEAPGLRALRVAGRRLGRDHLAGHGGAGPGGTARYSHQHARDDTAKRAEADPQS
jgi:Epoxide hydrolase N terminus